MISIVKLGEQFPKHHGIKEYAILVTGRGLKIEKQFLLEFSPYTQIRSQFQMICHTTDLPILLVH